MRGDTMNIRLGGRRTGRTTAMLAWLADNPGGVLLTNSEREVRRLREIVPAERRLSIIMVARPGCLLGQSGPVAFDNLDLYLAGLFGCPVDLATAVREKTP